MKFGATDKNDKPYLKSCRSTFAVKVVDHDRDTFSPNGFSFFTGAFLEDHWDDIIAAGLKVIGETVHKQAQLQQMQQNAYLAQTAKWKIAAEYGLDQAALQYPGKVTFVPPEQQLTVTPTEDTSMANGTIITTLTRNQTTIKSLLKRGWTDREITQLFVARSPLGTELDAIEQVENDIEVVRMWQANAASNATA
jgi:hypothetical protein